MTKCDLAIDIGGGVGRVTGLISTFFKETDLVEQNRSFINYAKKNVIGLGKTYNCNVKDFQFSKDYDLMWIQFLLMSLDNISMRNLLIKAMKNIARSGGVLIVKENISKDNKFVYNEKNKSLVRTQKFYQQVFKYSNLKIEEEHV